jgi:hypothetical protein
MRKLPALLFGLLIVTNPAHACRVAPQPINPATTRSDVVIVGRVFNVHLDGEIQGKWFSVRLESVRLGHFAASTYSTGWATGAGACGPRGPDVKENDQVVVYFRNVGGKLLEQGWTKTGMPDVAGILSKIPSAQSKDVR